MSCQCTVAERLSGHRVDCPDAVQLLHACTLGWPEIPSDATDNLCGRLGLMAEELTEDLDQVTCPDCLRAIAAWGQRLGQAACGMAFAAGALVEQLQCRVALGLVFLEDRFGTDGEDWPDEEAAGVADILEGLAPLPRSP